MSEKRKIRVGVLFGGKSGEHEVSLTSAQNVMAAMSKSKYEIVPIGITKTGLWLTGEKVMAQLTGAAEMPPQLAARAAKNRSLTPFLDASVVARDAALGALDVIFPVLHGPMGEDGTVQGLLELAGLPYVGCGVLGSAASMDKVVAKDILQAHDIPVLPYVTVLRKTWRATPAAVRTQIESALAYPVFVKPANMGSSVGISKVHGTDELVAAMDEAAQYDRRLLVEQGINAREIEVSILGNDDPQASVPGEVLPSREFYSYAAKYIDGDSDLLIPAPLESEQTVAIQQYAIAAFLALDCAGLARVDFLLDRETGAVYLNEVNAMPGFTEISMYPKLWTASGLGYSELIDRLIQLALERHAERSQNRTDFNVSEAT